MCRIKSYTFDIAPIPRSRPIDDFLRGLAFVRPPSASSVHPSSRSRGWAPLSSARPHLAISHHQHCCGEIARGHEPSQDGTGRRATQITDETGGRRAWWGAVAVAATRWHQPAKQHPNLAGLPQALGSSSSSIQCLVCVWVSRFWASTCARLTGGWDGERSVCCRRPTWAAGVHWSATLPPPGLLPSLATCHSPSRWFRALWSDHLQQPHASQSK